jgi:hypothetical protein
LNVVDTVLANLKLEILDDERYVLTVPVEANEMVLLELE